METGTSNTVETAIIKSVANYLICKCWGELPEAPAYVAT
jgi:hypothetical protein